MHTAIKGINNLINLKKKLTKKKKVMNEGRETMRNVNEKDENCNVHALY